MNKLIILLGIAIPLLALSGCFQTTMLADAFEAQAKTLCEQETVDSVYSCGDHYRVVSSLMGGGSSYYKIVNNSLEVVNCPLVAPDSMSEECKELFASECEEKKIC